MIKTENMTINGKPFVKTYSDTHCIACGGVVYEVAIDPEELGRVYAESTIPLPELTSEDTLAIILGGETV